MPAPIPLSIDPADHIEWALSRARAVARRYRLRGQERLDLEGEALLALVEFAGRYDDARLPAGGTPDPAGAFRGMASKWIRSRCRREAARLLTGSHGSSRSGLRPVRGLPAGADGEDGLPDPWPDDPSDGWEAWEGADE